MRSAILAFVFLALSASAFSISVDTFSADYTIDAKTTLVTYFIYPRAEGDENFILDVPRDAKIVSFSVDGFFPKYVERREGTRKLITFPVNQSSGRIKVSFITDEYVDSGKKSYFTADIRSRYQISSLSSRLTLPSNSLLVKSSKDGGAVFPEGRIETDGTSMFIFWGAKNVAPENPFSMFVIYSTLKSANLLLVLISILAIAGAYAAASYFIQRRKSAASPSSKHSGKVATPPTEETPKASSAEERKVRHIYSHLKEEEQQIVNILSDRDGKIEQGTLVIITGFSKAHLSRLLAELEERKIIHKEKKGKKNIIWLKEGR